MSSRSILGLLLAVGSLGIGLGAAPAAPTFFTVERKIDDIRKALAEPTTAQPNAPGWNAFFDALRDDLHQYAAAQDEASRLVALNRVYQFSVALAGSAWAPAQGLREELRGWLRPRVRLAWAQRRLVESVRALPPSPSAEANRARWVAFVDNDLGAALRQYDTAATVRDRQAALDRVYGAINALQASNGAHPWVPSVSLETALNDLYNLPNLDISADLATLAPALSANVVTNGPVEHKGYVSMVTAGPKTGFGLLASADGIAFFNSQMSSSVTPIWDFQNQMAQDRRGRRATKMYQFSATTLDSSEVTAVAVIRPTGLSVQPLQTHSTDAIITSAKQPGKGFARFIASAIGFNQPKITQKVYEGAIPKIRQNVVTEGEEVAQEKTAEATAQKNAQLSRYLIGNDALAFRNILIAGLSLASQPTNALIGGRLQWLNARDQIGAYAPQPAHLAVPDPGVSADLHLASILTSMTRGYLQSDAVQGLENLLIVTHKVPPGAPPREGIAVTRNVDYATFLKAADEASAANDPKVLAVRVKRPGRSPEFAADSRGFLVALIHDFLIEVPAPAQMRQGGLAGPPARVLRITAPDAELTISFKVTAETQKEPIRLAGRIEDFDPGPGAQVYTVNEEEGQARPENAFTNALTLNVFRNRLRGQPIDVPLSNLKLQGFAIRKVSELDPSGWLRVQLERTSASPAAGIH